MHVRLIDDDDELDGLRPLWNRLARHVPFRSWQWLHTWWEHYGASRASASIRRQLYVVAVEDEPGQELLALAPMYLEQHSHRGRQLQWLGSGRVCSDYQTVLARPGWEAKLAEAIADFLAQHAGKTNDPAGWDQISLDAVDAEDAMMSHLVGELSQRDLLVYGRPEPNTWRIELPATWDEYLQRLSASHRKQLRRLERRYLKSDHAILRTADDPESIAAAWPLMLDLHARRRRSLGDVGCFETPCDSAFHLQALRLLAEDRRARLHWLQWQGAPAAIEYHLLGDSVTYAYQSGLEPALLEHEPGRVLQLALLRLALAEGMRALDFLRGDEPYKAHWRARPRAALQMTVIPGGLTARLRYGIWLANDSLRTWMRTASGASPALVEPATFESQMVRT